MKKALSVFFIAAFLFLSACNAEKINVKFELSNYSEDNAYNIFIDGEEPSDENSVEPGAMRELKKSFTLKNGELLVSIYVAEDDEIIFSSYVTVTKENTEITAKYMDGYFIFE